MARPHLAMWSAPLSCPGSTQSIPIHSTAGLHWGAHIASSHRHGCPWIGRRAPTSDASVSRLCRDAANHPDMPSGGVTNTKTGTDASDIRDAGTQTAFNFDADALMRPFLDSRPTNPSPRRQYAAVWAANWAGCQRATCGRDERLFFTILYCAALTCRKPFRCMLLIRIQNDTSYS